jgi:hypothetical protein
MPATKAPDRYFKNAKTWKQISTNVPPEMHKALKQRVTRDYTMSQLLRELVAESELMRGGFPQPRWSVELSKELAALRREISELRAETRPVPEMTETQEPTAEKITTEDTPTMTEPTTEEEEDWTDYEEWPIFPTELIEPSRDKEVEAEKTAPPAAPGHSGEKRKRTKPFAFLGKLSEMLGVARKSA